MTVVDQLVAALDAISDRAELVAFLAPLRAPNDLSDSERARLTSAVVRAAGRCWKGRAAASC
jgi:hypothetical protein